MTLLVACEQFVTEDEVVKACGCKADQLNDQLGPDALAEIVDAATDIVANATGRRVTGRCTVTVRPCGDGVCGCWGRCSCCNVDGVTLFGVDPEVVTVKIDGVVQASALYKLINGRQLVLVSGGTWPGIQNIAKADTEVGTFSITFEHGRVDYVARMATREMACDLIQHSLPNGKPQLPQGVIAALMDGTSLQVDVKQLVGFPWMARLQAAYPLGPQPVIWSPEVAGGYTLYTVA